MTSTNRLRRLLPSADGVVSVEEAYAAPLGEPVDAAGRRRPWIALSMVATIDGSTVVEGRSGTISNPTDAAVLRRSREFADVLLIGAGNARAEGYGPPAQPGQRLGVVTRNGEWVDPQRPLFASGAGFLITLDDATVPDGVDVIRAGGTTIDLGSAIARLGEVLPSNPTHVNAEGGAHLNGALYDAGLLDEINLTISATLAGGSGPRLTTGAGDTLTGYELRQLCVDDESFIYTRWRRS